MTMIKKAENHSRAYWCGWFDGRYGDTGRFTENRRLTEWETPSSRLDYYRGHRAGMEARQHSGDFLEVS
jgi:hypothetical protein